MLIIDMLKVDQLMDVQIRNHLHESWGECLLSKKNVSARF